jgi:hypothetical protein
MAFVPHNEAIFEFRLEDGKIRFDKFMDSKFSVRLDTNIFNRSRVQPAQLLSLWMFLFPYIYFN